MDNTRRLLAAFALTLCAVSPLVVSTADAAKPLITSSSSTNTALTIRGENLGPGATSVLLGKSGRLAVISQTPTKLVVALPLTRMPIGNYLVSVQVGDDRSDVDEFVVTLGIACAGVIVFEGDESFCKSAEPADKGLGGGRRDESGVTGGGGCSGCSGFKGCKGCKGCSGDSDP